MKSTIQGIPCWIEVTGVHVQKPLGPSADNDLDCYGYSEVDYYVCDRNKRPAPWLEKKMTIGDEERIKEEILNDHEED